MLARPPVPGTPHPEQHVLVAGNGALHHQDVAGRITLDDSEVLHGHLTGPHVAGHLQPLDDAAGVSAGADRAGGTGAVGLAVGLGPAMEAVALHHPGKAAALGCPRYVHEVALLEYLAAHLLPDLPFADVVHAELSQVLELAQPLQVTLLGCVDPLARAEAQLDGRVAVVLLRLHLDDRAGPGLDHRDRHGGAVVAEDLGHAQLSSQDTFDAHSLISMSTPEGICRRMRASTVLDVGSRMSTNRLCVRISNCSRESLSMWGERMTQNFLISVGRGTGPATAAPVRSAASTMRTADWSRMR